MEVGYVVDGVLVYLQDYVVCVQVCLCGGFVGNVCYLYFFVCVQFYLFVVVGIDWFDCQVEGFGVGCLYGCGVIWSYCVGIVWCCVYCYL